MKQAYSVKTIAQVADVDTTSRRVKIVGNEMGTLDLDNDVMDITSFDKSIAERGPKGKNMIWFLQDHYPSLDRAISKFSEVYVEGNRLIGIADLPTTTRGNDMMEMYNKGFINQHSVGFRTIRREIGAAGTAQEHSIIKEALLYEISAVLWGANPNTPTLSVGKAASKEDILKRYKELKGLKNSGRMSDDFFPILDAQIKETEIQIIEFFTTETKDEATTTPESEDSTLPGLKNFTDQLRIANFLTALKQ